MTPPRPQILLWSAALTWKATPVAHARGEDANGGTSFLAESRRALRGGTR
jgi:hypothetical protein